MGRYLLFLFMISAVISGCTRVNTINKNPNILLQYPYNKVEYIAEPEKSHQVIEVVQVTTRGEQANILNTIPKLYDKALGRFSYRKKVQIGNINIILFTRRELFWVPYDDCKLVHDTRPGASGYYQKCTIHYRTEARDVLYQKATADLLTLKEE